MSEIMDIRLHHHLAQEFYRQQMLQRIPGNSSCSNAKHPLMDAFFVILIEGKKSKTNKINFRKFID